MTRVVEDTVVAPYVGAWIETDYIDLAKSVYNVAPYVGAWIETIMSVKDNPITSVAPYVGAWIETFINVWRAIESMSHPTWVRGLKLESEKVLKADSVAPYVGAWIETKRGDRYCRKCGVAPYVGAWIETLTLFKDAIERLSRTLRGCVD